MPGAARPVRSVGQPDSTGWPGERNQEAFSGVVGHELAPQDVPARRSSGFDLKAIGEVFAASGARTLGIWET